MESQTKDFAKEIHQSAAQSLLVALLQITAAHSALTRWRGVLCRKKIAQKKKEKLCSFLSKRNQRRMRQAFPVIEKYEMLLETLC